MQALLIAAALTLLLGGAGFYFRSRDLRLIGNGFLLAAGLGIVATAVRLAPALPVASLGTSAESATAPRPTLQDAADLRGRCPSASPVPNAGHTRRFCECTVEAWTAGSASDHDLRILFTGGGVSLHGRDDAIDAFHEAFGRCGASSARAWIASACRHDCSGALDCSGHCACMGTTLMQPGAPSAALALWSPGVWDAAWNTCLGRRR